jgi:hypothetical protein
MRNGTNRSKRINGTRRIPAAEMRERKTPKIESAARVIGGSALLLFLVGAIAMAVWRGVTAGP